MCFCLGDCHLLYFFHICESFGIYLSGPKNASNFANSHEPDTYYLEINILVMSKATQITQLNKDR